MGLFFQWDRVEQAFANQFEPDGENFRYRRWQKSAPLSVTSAERAQFIRQFHLRLRYASFGIFIATISLIAGFVLFAGTGQSQESDLGIWISLGIILVLFTSYWFWAYTAPSRALARRTPVGRARSREEMRRLSLGRISYGQLAGAAVAAWVMAYFYSRGHDMFSGWYLFWPFFAGAITITSALQALRKWHLESADRPEFPLPPE